MSVLPNRSVITAFKNAQNYKKEGVVLFYYIILSEHFRLQYDLLLSQVKEQERILNDIQQLSQHYNQKLCKGANCVLPDGVENLNTIEVLKLFRDQLRQLRVSNEQSTKSLHDLRRSCLNFEYQFEKLDFNTEADIIVGDQYHRPLKFHLELTQDLFEYFWARQLKMNYMQALIEPGDESVLQEYIKFIQISEDIKDYLSKNLTYCQCVEPKPICQMYEELKKAGAAKSTVSLVLVDQLT